MPVKVGKQVVFERVEPKSESESLTDLNRSVQHDAMSPSAGQPESHKIRTFSLYPSDIALLKQESAAAGMNQSEYLRLAIREKAERNRAVK